MLIDNTSDLNRQLSLADLADRPLWVRWWGVPKPDGSGFVKQPFNPKTGFHARANDPSTWGTRQQAERAGEPRLYPAGGVGLEFAPAGHGLHLGGIDLDVCRDPETGALEDWAQAIIADFPTYAEISPSRTGVKLFFLYRAPEADKFQQATGNDWKKTFSRKAAVLGAKQPAIELHWGAVYYAVTDDHLAGTPTHLATIPAIDILDLINITGPAFAGKKDAPRSKPGAGDFDWDERKLARVAQWDGPAALAKMSAATDNRVNGPGNILAKFTKAAMHNGWSPAEILDLLIKDDRFDEYFTARKGAEDAARLVQSAWQHVTFEPPFAHVKFEEANQPEPYPADLEHPTPPRVRARVELVGPWLSSAVIDPAENALLAARVPLFERGSRIVRPKMTRIRTRMGDVEGARLFNISAGEMEVWFNDFVDFGQYKRDKDGNLVYGPDIPLPDEDVGNGVILQWSKGPPVWCRSPCFDKLASTYADFAGRRNLRNLRGVINAPTLRPDGSLLQQPGYDEQTHLLYNPQGVSFLPIPLHPAKDDAHAALLVLERIISTFKFVSETDHAAWLAGALTASIRSTLSIAPAFGVDAPQRASGKGKLADMLGIICTGHEPATINVSRGEEELEKALGAALMQGDGAILIDNVVTVIDGQFLCTMLTQQTVSPRILGKSKNPTLPTNVLLLFTGNNLQFRGDMTTRTIRFRIDPETARPEKRVFTNDPVADTKRMRPELIRACLTILHAYNEAGRPGALKSSRFTGWSEQVRSALIWLGKPDVETLLDALDDEDPAAQTKRDFVLALHAVFGSTGFRVPDILAAITTDQDHLPADAISNLSASVREVAKDLRGDSINAEKLGKYLRTIRDSIVDDTTKLAVRNLTPGAKRATWSTR